MKYCGVHWRLATFTGKWRRSLETCGVYWRLAVEPEIALAFGVPPMLLGVPGDATYSTYQEANRAFYRLTVLPLVGRVAAAMGAWLAGFAGEAVALKPDLDQVPALAVERDAQWNRVAQADFLTQAEKRHLLGLPALAEGEDG